MGARMIETFPVVPLGGNLDVSVGIISYDGQLNFGLYADGETAGDVATLAEGIEKSFVELRHLADAIGEVEA
jgi:diacylglycerol O-acyltransferase / wax synthase